MSKILPVILAGGSGTRLWPLSRELSPKQFLKLYGKHSMMQHTLKRLASLELEPAYIVCNEEHRFLVAEQFRELNASWGALILEPAGRNTAPAIALAALHALEKGQDPVMLVLPADHYIENNSGFCAQVAKGVELVQNDALMTFGIVPEYAETGYGYIKKGPSLAEGGSKDKTSAISGTTTSNISTSDATRVDKFVEKPDQQLAQSYLDSGDYLWNSGIFLFKASAYIAELKALRPDIYKKCKEAVSAGQLDMDFYRPGESFLSCPAESIDFAVMEHTERAIMLPLDVGWNDLGSWRALWDISKQNPQKNVEIGDVISKNCENTMVYAQSRLVATLGLNDLVVVETPDAILVANKSEVQNVKEIVDEIKSSERTEHATHTRVYRPWGSYETVELGQRYQVKRITVSPGSTLSLQMHHHRAEHWIVVRGTAQVECDERTFRLSENESTYIPLGSKHRLSNPGKMELDLIEVQVGSYLGEDDIVRYEDKYGRG
ncbi:MAG: mannose-1-phosphate guanylyltransferase/mannose-6-phosphate isomerase [Pseudomonadales bacterium]|nr:mannose-1-phosphate guanylyltransferase/mannose-6-phosphate isomerase [Pseudomonadales bacterium]